MRIGRFLTTAVTGVLVCKPALKYGQHVRIGGALKQFAIAESHCGSTGQPPGLPNMRINTPMHSHNSSMLAPGERRPQNDPQIARAYLRYVLIVAHSIHKLFCSRRA